MSGETGGLREAAEVWLDALDMALREPSTPHDRVQARVAATRLRELLAALACPRPALPTPLEVLPQDDPTLVDVIAGLAVACGEARVREEYRLAAGGERRYTPLPEETKLFDMLDRAHLQAALPTQERPR